MFAVSPQESDLKDRVQAYLGTATMATASVFAVLIFSDRMDMEFVRFPAIWYSSRQLHLVVCGAMFLSAAILLKYLRPEPNQLAGHCFVPVVC